jgi:hypothetical protein
MVYAAINDREFRTLFEVPEKYVGYWVRDPQGRKIGRVKELFTNTHDEPEYDRVKTSFFGPRSVLLPIGFVAVDEKRQTLTLQ